MTNMNLPYPMTPTARPNVAGNGVLYYTFPLLERFSDRFLHGCSTRIGGVSTGSKASLDLSTDPDNVRTDVRENYRRFGEALGFDWQDAALTRQMHTAIVRKVTAADACKGIFPGKDDPIDGILTGETGLPLLAFSADCTPLLFYAADRHMAACVHAGWRGTVANIAANTVAALEAEGCDPAHIYVGIGPSAGPCCYEVDEDTAAQFRAIRDEQGSVLRPHPEKAGKWFPDLWRANRALLMAAGVPAGNIAISGLCTICNGNVFYSYRTQGNGRGSLAAAVCLR